MTDDWTKPEATERRRTPFELEAALRSICPSHINVWVRLQVTFDACRVWAKQSGLGTAIHDFGYQVLERPMTDADLNHLAASIMYELRDELLKLEREQEAPAKVTAVHGGDVLFEPGTAVEDWNAAIADLAKTPGPLFGVDRSDPAWNSYQGTVSPAFASNCTCQQCGAPAYEGFTSFECSKGCER